MHADGTIRWLSARGRFFCAGADVSIMQAGSNAEERASRLAAFAKDLQVMGIHNSRRSLGDRLARTIVQMADSLDVSTVVAEGIETEAQLARLRDLGCRFGQGYLLSRPLERDAYETLLAEHLREAATAGLEVLAPIADSVPPPPPVDVPATLAEALGTGFDDLTVLDQRVRT